jgi:feruloyl-CoA synthase
LVLHIEMGLCADKPLLVLSENSIEHGLMGLACTYICIPYALVSPAYCLVSKDHAKLNPLLSGERMAAIASHDA